MELITLEELNKNYDKYKKKFVRVLGYYENNTLYTPDKTLSVDSPPNHYLSISYCLNKMKQQDYRGMMEVVGMPSATPDARKSISYIVKIELLDDNERVTDVFVNRKIQMPKELRGKI